MNLRFTTSLLAGWLAVSAVVAQSDNAVYRCIGDDGVPTYTNNTVGLKGCQTVTGVSVTTIPAFKPPAPAAPAPSTSAGTRSNVGPADFPKVDLDQQRQRDELGRRPILERELRDREERCTNLRKDVNGGPARQANETDTAFGQRQSAMRNQLERCDADLAAIRREINAIK
jgi:Domain of unknown function (DUF4124)